MNGSGQRANDSRSSSPSIWRVICSKELHELWIGGKGLYLILIYSVLLGIYSYLLASNAEVNLMPLREMVLEMVKASIAVSLLICLIVGADSISGERERVTLEGILLTPASRRQIVFGKLVAAVSPWPVALAITIPFWIVLSRGDSVIKIAVIWGPALGTLLAPAMAGMGILVSLWSNTNKSSMLVSQGLYLLLLLPNELMAGPAKVQRTAEQWLRADFLDWINPLAATSRFLFKTFMNNLQPVQLWFWLTMPVLFTLFILAVLFLYAGPRLRLDAETARMTGMLWGNWQRRFGVTTAPGR